MDNLTHTLFAVTLGRTPLGRAGRGTMAALVVASNAPDIDVVVSMRGAGSYLQWHRGPTHGPVGVVGLGLATAALVWAARSEIDRRRGTSEGARNASFAMLVAASVVGTFLHVMMDFPTSYGTRLLSPFDWHWFAVDWMPIVDVYLLIVLTAGLMFGRASATARRRNAALALVLMAANYGLRGVAHHEALALAPRVFGPLLPKPCDTLPKDPATVDRWPRPTPPASSPTGQRCLVDLAAIPRFFSPFEWRIIARLSNAYELHDIDLLDNRLRRPAEDGEMPWRVTVRYPNQWTPQVASAASTPLGQRFLGFSRFPAARWVVNDRTHETVVRLTDVRFVIGAVTPDQPMRRVDPFTATIRLTPDGHVIEERFGR